MNRIGFILMNFIFGFALAGYAQKGSMMEQIKKLQSETDPAKAGVLMNQIIVDNKLDTVAESEMIDIMKGTVAMAHLMQGDYQGFEQRVFSIRNKFNQTSYLNMAASELESRKHSLEQAEKYAKLTLDLYNSFKDDPKARPETMPESDWKRFMNFAQYPYNDTYAKVLFARGKYKEALSYQEKAFDDDAENGMPSSVERYAALLAKNDREDQAYELLTIMAKKGKSTEGMNEQLKSLYSKRKGSSAGFDEYFNNLQRSVVDELKKEFRDKMTSSPAPEFTLLNLKGDKVSLADFRGKVVVLDFWATWCQPCIASFPAMKKAMEKHSDVVFLYIATQENPNGARERVEAFIEKNNYPFHVLMDEVMNAETRAYKVVGAYKPQGIPAKVIIDANGVQRFLSMGFSSETELINELDAMIALAKEAAAK